MKSMSKLPFLIIFLLLNFSLFSQEKSFIRGIIIDDQTGEPLFAANVGLKGTSVGASADFDGAFELNVNKGTYTLIASFIGYDLLEISDLNVSDQILDLGVIRLVPSSISLKTLTITAEAKRNTEAALITVKRKSSVLMDAVSAQEFKKAGDGNAASAAKRVSGVSIDGGKYVFVRGLGDRYTKTQLNGMDIPGLDPDRNSIQMDIFPANIIDNIKVLKSFSANLPADFTGGVVDIETKSFPSEPNFSTSFNLSYNPNSNLINNFVTYDGSSTDIFGFDSGDRDIPFDRDYEISFGDWLTADDQQYNSYWTTLNSFNKDLSVKQKTSFLNSSFSISGGNQINLKNYKLGYTAALSHKNNYEYYKENVTDYSKDVSNRDNFELEIDEQRDGEIGKNESQLALMLGTGLKNEKSKYKLNLLHLQSGESRAAKFNYVLYVTDQGTIKRTDVLDYTERSITNLLFSGDHFFKDATKVLSWRLSPSYSKIRDKDIRETSYIYSETTNLWYVAVNTPPTRRWRYLDEYGLPISFSYLNKSELFGRKSKFDIGLNYSLKFRKFDNTNVSLKSTQSFSQADFSGDPDELLTTLLAPSGSIGKGFVFESSSSPSNRYDATQQNISFYVQEEFFPIVNLKSVVGVRFELYQQFFNGQNQDGVIYNNTKVIDDFDFYPTLNLIYDLSESNKLRASLFRTTARPSFKEKADVSIIDAVSGYIFNGNINLEVSKINNLDLRFESYFDNNQTASVSIFYKNISNAIELSSYTAAPSQVRPVNSDNSNIKGIEFECKLRIPLISDLVNNFRFNFNTSLISSRTYITGQELNGRSNNLRNGELLTDNNDIQERFLRFLGINSDNDKIYRVMQGQSPYLINGGLTYENEELKVQSGLFYNVQGPTLNSFTIGEAPDIYTKPFNSLNFSIKRKFGKNSKYLLDLGVKNILNSKKELTTSSYGSNDLIYRSYKPGSLSYIKLNINL